MKKSNKLILGSLMMLGCFTYGWSAFLVYKKGTGEPVEGAQPGSDLSRYKPPVYGIAEVENIPGGEDFGKSIFDESTGQVVSKSVEEIDAIDNDDIYRELLAIARERAILSLTNSTATEEKIMDLISQQLQDLDIQEAELRAKLK